MTGAIGNLQVNSARVVQNLRSLAQLSACPDAPPAVTRIVFTQQDREARQFLADLYDDVGLAVRVDSVGNVFARWSGTEPSLPAVGTGSHTDAIPFSGMYDGTVGVLGGLEAVRALKQAGFQPRRSIELLMLTSEEPTRFGIGCSGSRALVGQLTDSDGDKLVDDQGMSFNQVRQEFGCEGAVSDCVLGKDYYHAWVELHIEQGPELEEQGIPIGIVTAIAAPATLLVKIQGQGGHAGAVLMPRRHDALCAASECVLAIERLAKESQSPDFVATVGELQVYPGAVNSIPSRVQFSIDLRDIDLGNRDRIKQDIETMVKQIGSRRGVDTETQTLNADPPAIASQHVLDAAKRACEESGLDYRCMVSRAYHDSLFLARITPMAMLFIPCRAGVSHRPDEYSSEQQIGRGVEVLARTLADLASS